MGRMSVAEAAESLANARVRQRVSGESRADYKPIHHGILVVTDVPGAQFTWGIANTVRACGGSYKKKLYGTS